jgi:thioredoxin 1
MKLTSEELQEKIDSGEKFIVDLYADWCGPCRMLGPIVEKVGKQTKRRRE